MKEQLKRVPEDESGSVADTQCCLVVASLSICLPLSRLTVLSVFSRTERSASNDRECSWL